MKIMGVDPSITRTGIGLPDQTTFTVSSPKQVTGDDRLEYYADHIGLAARTCGADLVVMEDAPTALQGNAGRVLLHLQGVLRLELKRNHVPYMILSPSTLKLFATGNGGADKTGMALAAYKRLGREYATDDECDADWLRIAGRFAYGYGEPVPMWSTSYVTLPQVNLKALRWAGTGKKRHEIVWPEVGGHTPWPTVQLRTTHHAPGKAVLCPTCAEHGLSVCV
jgi:Holliday junction resolvasome RuvABC endonuclease subunit